MVQEKGLLGWGPPVLHHTPAWRDIISVAPVESRKALSLAFLAKDKQLPASSAFCPRLCAAPTLLE